MADVEIALSDSLPSSAAFPEMRMTIRLVDDAEGGWLDRAQSTMSDLPVLQD